MSSDLLTAAEFAKVCQVTPRTIRWYQHKEIIKPVKIDLWNKYAYFAPEQALEVFRVKLLQQFNIPLREIKTLLNKKPVSLDEELDELDKFIKGKQRELIFLKEINSILNKDNLSLKKESIGPFRLFCHRIEKGDYHKFDQYFSNLRLVAGKYKINLTDSEINFYNDIDNEYKPKKSDLEIAIEIKQEATLDSQIFPEGYYVRKFPKTRALTFIFKGPYIYLSLAYKKTDKFIKDRKIKVKGSVFDLYLKNPTNTKCQYDYITKICYPI